MANGKKGLLGKKMGMTQLFTDDGAATAVTVIDLSSNTVIRVKTAESADGYDAVQIGICLLYTSPSPRDRTRSRMPSSA